MSAVRVRGYRGRVTRIQYLVDAAGAAGAPVQVVRAERVWDRAHVERAAALAARAFAEGRNRAQALPLEFACYLSGERQIGKALKRVGVSAGENMALVAVAFGDAADAALDTLEAKLPWTRDDAVLDAPRGRDDLVALGVDAALADAVPPEKWSGLVLERVALTDLGR